MRGSLTAEALVTVAVTGESGRTLGIAWYGVRGSVSSEWKTSYNCQRVLGCQGATGQERVAASVGARLLSRSLDDMMRL